MLQKLPRLGGTPPPQMLSSVFGTTKPKPPLAPGLGAGLTANPEGMVNAVPGLPGVPKAIPSGAMVPQSIPPVVPSPLPGGLQTNPAGMVNAVAPPPIGGVAPVTGAGITKIDPLNDLRSTAITPDGTGPDRTALAQQKFNDLMSGYTDDYKLGVEGVGRDAARLGRIGMGGVGTSVGNLRDVLERRKIEGANALASNVAEGDISDRRANRGELRGERDYQTGRADNAIDRSIQQRAFEESLLDSGFNRDVTRTSMGYAGNPASFQVAAGGAAGDASTSGYGDAAEFMREMARIRAQRQSKAGTV